MSIRVHIPNILAGGTRDWSGITSYEKWAEGNPDFITDGGVFVEVRGTTVGKPLERSKFFPGSKIGIPALTAEVMKANLAKDLAHPEPIPPLASH